MQTHDTQNLRRRTRYGIVFLVLALAFCAIIVLNINIGSVNHPMADEHYIEWVYVETENGGQRKNLKPGEEPNVTFNLGDDKAVAVYAYCNLHGLWKTEV